MTRSLVTLWVTLVAAIVTIAVLAQFWIAQRQRSSQQRVGEILLSRLSPFNDSIERLIASYSVTLQREADSCDLLRADRCVELTRSPLVASLIVVNAEAQLVFPTDVAGASQDRQSLYDEAQQLLREMSDPRPRQRVTAAEQSNQSVVFEDLQSFNSRSYKNRSQQAAKGVAEQAVQPAEELSQALLDSDGTTARSEETPESSQEFGWITWYHRRGMVLGFWWSQGPERRAIATIPRARWMADIVATLPDAIRATPTADFGDATPLSGSLNQLIDVEGNVIYQWGDLPSETWADLQKREPDAVLSVVPPLEGWRLRVFASASFKQSLAGDSLVLPLWLAVFGLTLSLLLGGVLVTTSFNRQMRLARRRVSFVNQVSHELRTPLTNICLYADLLAISLHDDTHGDDYQKISIIQNECQRLSRLISNVLHFARTDSPSREIQAKPAVLDDVVSDVLAKFGPRLFENAIETSLDLSATEQRMLDPDVVEQILVNLVGNAEKYAAVGERIEISTRTKGDLVEIVVRDFGPGVPARLAEKIFAPFYRIHHKLEDPTGTGIGLTIVRDLARRHGGDCILDKTHEPTGASFRCQLHAPPASSTDQSNSAPAS